MKKLLVVGVIILFLSLALAPSIHANTNNTAVDSELVEITTEVCGLPGLEPQTVKLSQEDAQAVDKLFDDIKSKLDKAETREEAVNIFNEAIVELDKYGLLGGLSVERAQRLVTGGSQNFKLMKLNNGVDFGNEYIINSNLFCLVAGETSETSIVGPIAYRSIKIINNLLRLVQWAKESPFEKICALLYGLLIFIGVPLVYLMLFYQGFELCPNILFGGAVGLGSTFNPPEGGPYYTPSTGWISTFGLLGKKNFEGPFYGQSRLVIYDWVGDYHIGIIRFFGIKCYKSSDNYKYIGFALRVSVGPEHP